jgi:hypothetical protein
VRAGSLRASGARRLLVRGWWDAWLATGSAQVPISVSILPACPSHPFPFPPSLSPPFPCPSLALLLSTILLVHTLSFVDDSESYTVAEGLLEFCIHVRVLAPLDFGVLDLWLFFSFNRTYMLESTGSGRCVLNVMILFNPPFLFFFFFSFSSDNS